jgi:UDP-2-acetamido-2,6-beta-L-arabino-hexul-4-ose reductase
LNSDSRVLQLVYIDNVIEAFINILNKQPAGLTFPKLENEYSITLADLASQIKAFKDSRKNLITENVGYGLIRALYSTYISYLPNPKFVYKIPKHDDERGSFVEVLKTRRSGQFSFFTSRPGITRGNHYHHSKSEKFIVVKGQAQFHFRNILTNEVYAVLTSHMVPEIVETIPGWAHKITNTGTEDLIVMLWANEIFDKEFPDTISFEV